MSADDDEEYPDSRDPKPRAQVVAELHRELKRIGKGATVLKDAHYDLEDYQIRQVASLVADVAETVRDVLKLLEER